MQRLIRCALVAALVGVCGLASAADYAVTYNPYQTVNWGTTLRCQSQHHDHAYSASRITALANAGYCAAAYMTYSGAYRASTQAELDVLGNPNPDPGQPIGWGPPRRWPPESYGAPALPLNSLRFYLPGAEEIGLFPTGNSSPHMFALGLTTYMEGVGCSSCGIGGLPVHDDNPFGLSDAQRYSTSSEFVTKATALGALVTLNHPNGAPTTWDYINPYPMSIEMFNNYNATNDEGCGTHYSEQFMATWDHVLQIKSPRIWGVAANDWNSAWTPLGNPSVACWPQITQQNRDRGKLEVMLTSYDLGAYMQAFAAGAFFAVVENNAAKGQYPRVTDVAVGSTSIVLTTQAGNETIVWIGNGAVVGSGSTLALTGLPAGLVYVRAEIYDGDGRTVYTQPFSLAPPLADTTPPTDPTALVATPVSNTRIDLGWGASTDAVGVTGYRVERCAGASCSDFVQVATPIVSSATDLSLAASTNYSYRVRASDAAGNLSGWSNVASATTLDPPPPPDNPIPSMPTRTLPLLGLLLLVAVNVLAIRSAARR